MYDFHKIRNADNQCEFKHKFFHKGDRHLLHLIKRKHSAQFIPITETNNNPN